MDKHPGWREALVKARENFGKSNNFLGVNFCEKRKNGNFTGELAMVVYVRKKIRDKKKISKDEFIDEKFEGFSTDVLEPFSKDRPQKHLDYVKDHYRSHDIEALDLSRINQHHVQKIQEMPAMSKSGVVGQVFIMEDRHNRFITEENGENIPDLVEAYKAFRENYADEFDFVTFFSDVDSGMPTFDTSFHWGVFNDISGIGRAVFNNRDALGGSTKLQSIHFMHHTHLNRYVILHEVGHRWGAFVYFRENSEGPLKDNLLIQSGSGALHHWNIMFDDDQSPMDYDIIDWVENPDGTFSYVELPESHRKYCKLDLYLMGMLPPSQVGNFYYLDNPTHLEGQRFAATKKGLNIQNIIWAEGQRDPGMEHAQKEFRQAFVLLTKDYENALSLGQTIDRFRKEYEVDFKNANYNNATVDTQLAEVGEEETAGGYIFQEYHRTVKIPDKVPGVVSSSVSSTLSFDETAQINDIEVSMDITHSFKGDLKISLLGPDGTEVILHDRKGGDEDNIDKNLTIADIPDLSKFIGKTARGSWSLKITDLAEDDTGELNGWSIKLGFNGDIIMRDEIFESVEELNTLCKEEYGKDLITLLNESNKSLNARRLRRLTGILLKRNFADPEDLTDKPTQTKAKRAWIWDKVKLEKPADSKMEEYQLLDDIRKELPVLLEGRDPSWETLQDEAQHERGLFKILALYVKDKLEKRQPKSFKEYYQEKEGPGFKALLDIGNTVFNFAMTPVYASILPVSGLVVAFSLIGIEYGFDHIFNVKDERDEDN